MPVLSGMIILVLASLPLLACQIVFFTKFGIFLLLTMAFFWILANFGFMSILATIGPAKSKASKNEDLKFQNAGAPNVYQAHPGSVNNQAPNTQPPSMHTVCSAPS